MDAFFQSTHLSPMFDAVVFAGGGNRCYWQGGFYEAAATRLGLSTQLVVGASAGAFAAVYSLLETGPATRARVIGACDPQLRNFDFAAWRQGRPLCPVGPLYTELLHQTIDAGAFRRIRHMTDFRVAVSRLPRGLSPSLCAAIGIGAYQLEKQIFNPVHPRFGRALGFRSEFVAVRSLTDPQQFREALMASSGVPPFMPVTNVPESLPSMAGSSITFPLNRSRPLSSQVDAHWYPLTRVYKSIPVVKGRTYVQPSRKIDVGQFDIRNPDGIRNAYELGLKDGDAFAISLNR